MRKLFGTGMSGKPDAFCRCHATFMQVSDKAVAGYMDAAFIVTPARLAAM